MPKNDILLYVAYKIFHIQQYNIRSLSHPYPLSMSDNALIFLDAGGKTADLIRGSAGVAPGAAALPVIATPAM